MIEKIRDVKQKEQTRLRETLMRFYQKDPAAEGSDPQEQVNGENGDKNGEDVENNVNLEVFDEN